MTCFWDGLRGALTPDKWHILGCHTTRTNQSLAAALQRASDPAVFSRVRWNGGPLRHKEIEEACEWVRSFDAKTMVHGYDCGSADPFLLLLTGLLGWSMTYRYCGVPITFVAGSRRTLTLSARVGHFEGQVRSHAG